MLLSDWVISCYPSLLSLQMKWAGSGGKKPASEHQVGIKRHDAYKALGMGHKKSYVGGLLMIGRSGSPQGPTALAPNLSPGAMSL